MSHGDETYHWTTSDFWINAGSVDNSIMALCGMSFLIDTAERTGREDLAAQLKPAWEEMRNALDGAWLDELDYYPPFVLSDGTKDLRPMLNTLLLGFFSGYHDKWSAKGVSCLGAAIRHLSMPGGSIMSSTDFPLYTGLNPGLYLTALAETDNPLGERALVSSIDLASATGTYFEYYDIYEHRRFGETIRAIEGGCSLTGIIEYLLGIRLLKGGIRIKPHLPSWLNEMELNRFVAGDMIYSIKVKDSQLYI